MGDSEDRFIQAFRKGDEQAFRKVYEQFFCALCRFLYRYVPDQQRAADLVQDVFVNLWRIHARFDSPEAVRAFLYIAARNRALNELRHEQMKYARIRDMQQDAQRQDEARFLIDVEMERQLIASMGRLSKQSRLVLELSLDGASYKEIGRQLNLSVNTVRNHRAYAVKMLKRIFETE